jgi:hypothetical protein
MFACSSCSKKYAHRGSLYKHCIEKHAGVMRGPDGALALLSPSSLEKHRSKVRHWGENSRQRRARLAGCKPSETSSGLEGSGPVPPSFRADIVVLPGPEESENPLIDASTDLSFDDRTDNIIMSNFGWMYDDVTPAQPFEMSSASVNRVVEDYLTASPAVTYDPDEFGFLLTFPSPSSVVPKACQTDPAETPRASCSAMETQTRNRNSDLNYESNKAVQAVTHTKDVGLQTDNLIGDYRGPLQLPANLSVDRVARAVIENPGMTLTSISRQLATLPSMRMVEDRALGLVETATHVAAATVLHLRRQLQAIYEGELMRDPSGESVLAACMHFMARFDVRPIRDEDDLIR